MVETVIQQIKYAKKMKRKTHTSLHV